MSAIDNGPDTVTVTTMVPAAERDQYGNYKLVPGTPVTYTGVSVQPAGLAAFGRAEDDGNINIDYVIYLGIKKTWVGGPHSLVTWNGVQYDQVGVVKFYHRGRRTKHQEVKIKARGTAVK